MKKPSKQEPYWAVMSPTTLKELAAPHFDGTCTVLGENWSKEDWIEFKSMVDELYDIATGLRE
jgi:hypothetical protein